jgi:polygalacturonase
MKIKALIFLLTFSLSTLYAQEKRYIVTDFKAIGDGKTMNTKAIQNAIDTCANRGGGKVFFPKGTYLTGSIHLKSHVNLEITEGAILLGSSKRDDYEKHDWYALILAKNQKQVAITGKGTIDGQGRALAQDVYRMMKAGLLPPKIKPYDRPDENQRPQIIEMSNCQNIDIQGVTIKNAACWVQTYHACVDMRFEKMTVNSTAYWNNDGLDLVDCKNVVVTHCSFNTADDGICLKSQDTKSCCENITIENCTVRSSASAVKLGTASYGGFKHISIKKIKVFDTYRSAVALECVDGGVMEDITVDGVDAKNVGNAFFVRLGHRYQARAVGVIKNVLLKNIKATILNQKPDKGYEMEGPQSETYIHSDILPASIVGLPNHFVQNIALENIKLLYVGNNNNIMACPPVLVIPRSEMDTFISQFLAQRKVPECEKDYPEFDMFGRLPSWGLYVRHTEGVTLKNVRFYLKEEDSRMTIFLEDTHNVKMYSVKFCPKKSPMFIVFKDVKKAQLEKISPHKNLSDKFPKMLKMGNCEDFIYDFK